jgi:hypothetical protein
LEKQFGEAEDQPVPADYLGLGQVQLAVYRDRTNEWIIRRPDGKDLTYRFGKPGDQAVPAPYAPRFGSRARG